MGRVARPLQIVTKRDVSTKHYRHERESQDNSRHGRHLADERVDEPGADAGTDLADGDDEACESMSVSAPVSNAHQM